MQVDNAFAEPVEGDVAASIETDSARSVSIGLITPVSELGVVALDGYDRMRSHSGVRGDRAKGLEKRVLGIHVVDAGGYVDVQILDDLGIRFGKELGANVDNVSWKGSRINSAIE